MIEKFISHRGNLYKKDVERENKLNSIYDVINKGFDCEIDTWVINDKIFLGHDEPLLEVDSKVLLDFKEYLWIHCKNLDALNYFSIHSENEFNYFWHQKDDFTLTSKNFIWTYPDKNFSENSVIVDLIHTVEINKKAYGLCSDNIYEAKNIY